MLYSTPKPENLAIVPYWRRLEREKQETRRLYFRLGWISPREYAILELRYNENHDPNNGRFTSGPGGAGNATDQGSAEHPQRRITRRHYKDLENGLPLKGEPDSILDKIGDKDETLQRRVYGPDGKAAVDFDTTNHGNAKTHPTGAHKHVFDYSRKNPHGLPMPLTEQDLTENSDIIREGVNYHGKTDATPKK